MYLSNGSGTDRCLFYFFSLNFGEVEFLQVAVKALLVYASDQLGEGMDKKTKVCVLMTVFSANYDGG